MKKLSTRTLILCAIFAALTAVFSQIAIPLPMVPINLAMLAVFIAGGVLGPWVGALSQVVYVLLGAIGLPVFSQFTGGLGIIVGPTGGYIAGYVVAALITGLTVQKWCSPLPLALGMVAGLAACYALGTAWFMVVTGSALGAALMTCVVPFLIGDAVKIAVAAMLSPRLRRELVLRHG
ncbi:biotin transporter BioY [Christensenellaceae bacterium NSJ-44]|uniref:Biotin transporter n=1 Tax=Luoshenia tenuis TaxID=2763654 RepID=A0A926D129_9FIRM|nr:biotin transporter BioY [Luoshenia tenuis]MBC8528375.1 biotin transporter BioY [Luoshenia tenuis]